MKEEPKRVSRTKLKFIESEKTREMIAFVTIDPENGRIFGVKQDAEVPKKIVLISKQITEVMTILPRVLYDVEIVAMGSHENNKSCKGFIATNVTPALFDALIDIDQYGAVNVKFGNKNLVYDPESTKPSRNNAERIVEMLENRLDIRDKQLVIVTFKEKVAEANQMYESKFQESLKDLKKHYAAA